MFEGLRRALPVNRLFHFYWRLSRGLTLGVRAMVLDGQGRVFLIRHTYANGWHLPGGGVEAGETLSQALARELAEEGNIELTGPPAAAWRVLPSDLFAARPRDGLRGADFRQTAPPEPNREIAAHGFFSLDALPPETTAGTRARIAEVLSGKPAAERW